MSKGFTLIELLIIISIIGILASIAIPQFSGYRDKVYTKRLITHKLQYSTADTKEARMERAQIWREHVSRYGREHDTSECKVQEVAEAAPVDRVPMVVKVDPAQANKLKTLEARVEALEKQIKILSATQPSPTATLNKTW